MKFFFDQRNQYVLMLALFVLTGLQISCSEETNYGKTAESPQVALTKVSMGEITNGLTYPTEIVEKSIKKGLGEPYLLPDYRSPNEQLFNRFQTNQNFYIRIDGEEIAQEELLNFNRSDIKAYKVIQSADNVETSTYTANLFTHEGYMKYADNWIEKLNDLKIRSERGELN